MQYIIKQKVWNNIKNVCTSQNGFVMELVSIDQIRMGIVELSTGNVCYPVIYTTRILRPKIGDRVKAEVVTVHKLGFECCVGPFSIFVARVFIPKNYEFEWDVMFGPKYVHKQTKEIIEPGVYVEIELQDVRIIRNTITEDDEDEIDARTSSEIHGSLLKGMGKLIDHTVVAGSGSGSESENDSENVSENENESDI